MMITLEKIAVHADVSMRSLRVLYDSYRFEQGAGGKYTFKSVQDAAFFITLLRNSPKVTKLKRAAVVGGQALEELLWTL